MNNAELKYNLDFDDKESEWLCNVPLLLLHSAFKVSF